MYFEKLLTSLSPISHWELIFISHVILRITTAFQNIKKNWNAAILDVAKIAN